MLDNSNSNSMLKNMLVLTTGTSMGKLLGILSIPIITRIYTPENLGTLSIFIAISSALIPFGTLGYSIALPLPKSDKIAANLAVLNIALLLIMTSFISIMIYCCLDIILNILSMEILVPYWWLFIITVLFAGVTGILIQWAIRKKAFKPLAKTKIIQSSMGEGTKIILGLLNLKPLGLIIGYMITHAGGTLTLSKIFIKELSLNIQYITKNRLLFLLKYYKDFPKYKLPSQVLFIFSAQSPLIFSAWLFGSETTGQLGLALMTLALPISLLGHSMGQAYYAEISKIGKNNLVELNNLTNFTIKRLFFISLLPFFILLTLSPFLFAFIFGEQWKEAGVYTSILATYLLTQFISSPLMNIFNLLGSQKNALKIHLFRLIIIIIIFYISYLFSFSELLTIKIYSYVLSVHYLMVLIRIKTLLKKPMGRC